MTDLLDAIDALTKPVVLHFPQVGDDGTWLKAHVTRLPPLLTQLSEAVVSSTSGRAGGGDPATRAVLNSDALFEFAKITSAIADWCRLEKVPVTRDPVADLRRWHVARLAKLESDDWYVQVLDKWVAVIRIRLEPPKVVPLTVPCVVCNAALWVDPDGETHPYPVVVEYMEHDPDILSSARATCRACAAVWQGSRELRDLRWKIDVAESKETA